MVASLRERETSGELAAVSRFPPSPDGGFIEGDLGASGVPEEEMFPPSPDGGFIEGPASRGRESSTQRWFPPSPDGGFIEGPWP